MPRGYRLAIIAIGLTLFAYQGHSQEAEEPALESGPVAGERQTAAAPDSNATSSNYSDPAERIVGELDGIKAAIRDIEAKIDAPESAETRERERRDVEAQERMAFWAMWMAFATPFTLGVTIFGVVYVRRTLFETRRLGQAQVRAYIIANGGTFHVFDKGIGYRINFRNVGQSPAMNCKLRCTVGISPPQRQTIFYTSGPASIVAIASGAEEQASFTFNNEGNPAYTYSGPPPRTPLESLFPNVPDDVVRALREGGGSHFNLMCTIGWDDVFGRRQNQTFSFEERESELITSDSGKISRSGSFTVGSTKNYRDDVILAKKETRYRRLLAKLKSSGG